MFYRSSYRLHERVIGLRMHSNYFDALFRIPWMTATKNILFDRTFTSKNKSHLMLIFEHGTLFRHKIETRWCLPSTSRCFIANLIQFYISS